MHAFFKKPSLIPTHHIFYISGIIQFILPLLFWLIELIGRYTTLLAPLKPNVPATWAHAFIMLYGFFVFFIFGFLINQLPGWMNVNTIKKEQTLSAVTWLNIGLLIIELSLFFNAPTIVSGCIVFLLGWIYSTAILYQVIKKSTIPNKSNPIIIILALISGALGIIGYGSWLYTGSWLAMQLSFDIGLWLYLMPVFFSLIIITGSHTSQKTNKENLYLYLFLMACFTHFLLLQLPLQEWLFLPDMLIFVVISLYLNHILLPCKLQKKLKIAIIVTFLWASTGALLSSLQSLWLLLYQQYPFNTTLLHIIYIGFFTSLVFISSAFLSSSRKHSIAKLNKIQWSLFIGLQLATATGLGAAVITTPIIYSNNLNITSAALCLLFGIFWIPYILIQLYYIKPQKKHPV